MIGKAFRLQKHIIVFPCLFPFFFLLWQLFTGRLGANPVKSMILFSGDWTMRFLIFTLAISPIANLLQLKSILKYRRLLGLFSLFYASLHLLIYISLDYLFRLNLIFQDALRTPFVIVGFGGYLLFILLGITSIKGLIRRLGKQRWSNFHRLVYVIAIGGIVHYILKARVMRLELIIYISLVSTLLLYRLVRAILKYSSIKISGE